MPNLSRGLTRPISRPPVLGLNASAIMDGAGVLPLTGDGYIGANLSGLEYAFISGEGPSASTITFAQNNVGVTIARVPISHEALQPSLGGELDQDEVDRVLALGARCWAAGISWYPENHNSGRYDPLYGDTEGHNNPGAHEDSYVLGSVDYPVAVHADYVGKMATAFHDAPGCLGAGPSNEPHELVSVNLAPAPNNFIGTGWVSTGSPGDVTLTPNYAANPFGTANDAWLLTSVSGWSGINLEVTVPAGAKAMAIYARADTGTQEYYWQKDGAGIMGGVVESANTSYEQQLKTFTATGTHNLTLFVEGPPGSKLVIWGMLINEGSSLLDLGANVAKSTWQIAVQADADAIDAVDENFGMFVCGDNFSGMAGWLTDNADLRVSRSGDGPVWFTPHDYPGDPTGNYTGDTHAGLAATIAAHVTARAAMIAHFESNNLRFIPDEMNVPGNNADAELWNADLADAIDQYQASPNCDGIVIWNIGQHEAGYPDGFFNLPNVENNVQINPDDTDQSRAVVWRSKAKAGPFVGG